MKKILITAAVAIFAVSAYAQTGSSTKVKAAKETRLEKKTHDAEDLNKDGKLSPQEKAARKAAKKAEKLNRKDLKDDGIINGSVKDNHGTDVSTTAKETTLEGKEKGKAISDAAKSKDKKVKHNEKGIKPGKGMRHSGAVKPMHRPGKG